VLRLKQRAGKTMIADLREADGYRLKFPRSELCEAMIVNTGGGLAGGDCLTFNLILEPHASGVLSSQSAEKIYKAQSDPARVNLDFKLADGSALFWLPQESIIFDGARFERRMNVEIASSACFAAFEGFVFGRHAMGEHLHSGNIADDWSIRRGGELIFAERLRLSGEINAQLLRPALGHSARMCATFLYVSPDAEHRLDEVRALLNPYQGHWGASSWNGLLCARFLDNDPARMRRNIIKFMGSFFGFSLPRVWQY
jgi:urease accessory protein